LLRNNVASANKKRAAGDARGPKFWEETPKKGSNAAKRCERKGDMESAAAQQEIPHRNMKLKRQRR
jgi:hypothetical protein